jgi:sulfur-oxidizing protein SoxB
MSLSRREFLHVLAMAAAAGLPLGTRAADDGGEGFYEVPAFGNVSVLHFTDCHAQLLPLWFREPDVNLGLGSAAGRPPHLVGEALLRAYGVVPGSREAYAFTSLDYVGAARTYGRVGGFGHLATLVHRLRGSRPNALLLDGGDNWQGSATALWTRGQDMLEVSRLLGIDAMTGHWEFTYGAERVRDLVDHQLAPRTAFLAQNVRTQDFDDPVFEPAIVRVVNGVRVAVIGQAFPYTPIAHPHRFVPEWTFGIQEERLQRLVDELRARERPAAVLLLSHNGMDVDLKLASRVRGIDAILGGHTHDAVPAPVLVDNAGGRTLVTNAGCSGKFLAVLDLEVRAGRPVDWRYRLLPVFSNLLPADPQVQAQIERGRAPFRARLAEPLCVADTLLYRRGNFNGTWDQLILDAILEVQGADIAFSPGFRWGRSLLPGETITREALMDQLAVTYPAATVTEMTGAAIKTVLEDVADNLFHPDPYYQQGGDMVRVGGLTYACTPGAPIGSRIGDLRLRGKPIDADRVYKVGGWAPVSEDAHGAPIWDVVETWLRARRRVAPVAVQPALIGVERNAGRVRG